jgi:hypothetical protein
MGGIELNDATILDDQRHRTVAHALEQASELSHERLQIVGSSRIETGQKAPPGLTTG